MGVIASLTFLVLPCFSQCFLYMLNETLSLLGSLYLLTQISFKADPSPLPLKISPFFVLSRKIQKSCFFRQLRKKTTKVNISNLLTG